MKGSDYIADFIKQQGVKHVFGISGKSIIHTFDSVPERGLRLYPVCHEQAAAMAADAYSRVTENIGAIITTSGPGATNALTGILCAYYDSIPLLVITGQVPKSQMKGCSESRQIGFQETNVVGMFAPASKYATLVSEPHQLKYELEKAAHIARTGRPGPVVLDICENVQSEQYDPSKYAHFIPEHEKKNFSELEEKVGRAFDMINKSERPVVILGGGIRLAGAVPTAREFIQKSGLPYTLTWAAFDYLPHDSPQFTGGFGVTSPRDGNFAVQNSDLIVAIGTRLDSHEVGNDPGTFARGAKKIVLDIDQSELDKYAPRGMHVDLPILGDARDFFDIANKNLERTLRRKNLDDWLGHIANWRRRYPICPQEYYKQKDKVNPYIFMNILSEETANDDVILTDCGGNLIWTMQGFRPKGRQRVISAFNHSPMGYSLPASMGATLAADRPVICITGDGGLNMNIQELGTIKHHNMPVKIFVMDNHGYGIMRGTVSRLLENRPHGVGPEGGVADPNIRAISEAYDIPTFHIQNHRQVREMIKATLEHDGPVLCDVEIESHHPMTPKLAGEKPIEDSSPLLSRDELAENMKFVPPLMEKVKS